MKETSEENLAVRGGITAAAEPGQVFKGQESELLFIWGLGSLLDINSRGRTTPKV